MVKPFVSFYLNVISFLDLVGIFMTSCHTFHRFHPPQKSESTSILISVSFWLIYTYQSRVSTFQKLPLSMHSIIRYCSSWAFDSSTIMSVIQVANQIIMFLTPTYILDHILGFVGEVLVTHKTIKNSKQKNSLVFLVVLFLHENFCKLGSSTIIWKEYLSICLLQRRRCLLQFLQKKLANWFLPL